MVWAARTAIRRRIPLTLVYAINLVTAPWPTSSELADAGVWQVATGRRILDEALKLAQGSTSGNHTIDFGTHLSFAHPVRTLIGLSKQADLMVVGRHGPGALARVVLGSVSGNLVRKAHCPVAVIPDTDRVAPDVDQFPVLLGTDGSPASELATAIAFQEASCRHVDLVALHAWSGPLVEGLPELDWSVVEAEEQRWMGESLAGWQRLHPDVTVHRHLVRDRPAHAIIQQANAAQLVVLGSRGRGKVARTLLGSVSNAVVQAVQVPIIVARR